MAATWELVHITPLDDQETLMNPKARPSHVTLQAEQALHLTPTAQKLLDLCDGTRSVTQLAELLDLPSRVIFAELDQLADANLLLARHAPPANQLATHLPAGMSRREALTKLALGAAGGFAALSLGARQGLAQDRLDEATKAEEQLVPTDKETAQSVEAEILVIEKRIKERQLKREQALDCRRKQTDKNTVSEERAKAKSCANPGQLQTEIAQDKQQLLQKRKVERSIKQRDTHLEREKKKQSP